MNYLKKSQNRNGELSSQKLLREFLLWFEKEAQAGRTYYKESYTGLQNLALLGQTEIYIECLDYLNDRGIKIIPEIRWDGRLVYVQFFWAHGILPHSSEQFQEIKNKIRAGMNAYIDDLNKS